MSFGTEDRNDEAIAVVNDNTDELNTAIAVQKKREAEMSQLVTFERAQIDAQISTAKAFPRSLSRFLTNCKAAATIDRETAESLFYAVPVGKEGGRQKYVEGPSIRLAELVAAHFGNLHMESGISEETQKAVVAYAIVIDVENNVARKFVHSESIMGNYGRYSDRQVEKLKEVAQSKALRKAIFTVVPQALIKPIITAAKQVISGGKTMEERRADLVRWFTSMKIDFKRIWCALGIEGQEEINGAHLMQMTGVFNAIKNGETTVDEAFPPISRFGQGESPAEEKKKMPRFKKQEPEQPKEIVQSAPAPATTDADVANMLYDANSKWRLEDIKAYFQRHGMDWNPGTAMENMTSILSNILKEEKLTLEAK